MRVFQQINKRKLPKLNRTQSERNSQSYGEDIASTEQVTSKVRDKMLTAGLLRLDAGTPLKYRYLHEELNLIVAGEFHLSDGTGQQMRATAGDLIYIPTNTNVTFETRSTALIFYCGQREDDPI